MTLQTALGEYQEYKLEDDLDSRETEQRVARLRKDLRMRRCTTSEEYTTDRDHQS